MAKKTNVSVILLVAVTAAATSLACRSPRRGVRVGSESATLKVTMTLPSGDDNRPEWIYELSGCVATVTGSLTAANTATFTGTGLKKGLTGCQLRVRTLNAAQGMKFESEPGVLYWVKDMPISQEADGSLAAVANLQRLYAVEGTSAALFTLRLPVKFAADEAGQVVTAGIQCAPEILTVGTFERATATEGEFIFKSEIPAEASYACTGLEVRVDGAPGARHQGAFAGDAGKFTAKPGETVKLAPLALTAVAPPAATGVDVITTGKDCNEDGQVYNPETRKCETKE